MHTHVNVYLCTYIHILTWVCRPLTLTHDCYTHIHIYTYTYTYTYIYTYTYAYNYTMPSRMITTYIHIHIHICTYTYIHTYMHTSLHIHTLRPHAWWLHIYIYTYIYKYIYTYTDTIYIYAYIYKYTYTHTYTYLHVFIRTYPYSSVQASYPHSKTAANLSLPSPQRPMQRFLFNVYLSWVLWYLREWLIHIYSERDSFIGISESRS